MLKDANIELIQKRAQERVDVRGGADAKTFGASGAQTCFQGDSGRRMAGRAPTINDGDAHGSLEKNHPGLFIKKTGMRRLQAAFKGRYLP